VNANLNTARVNTRSIHLNRSGTQSVASGNALHRNVSETDTTGTLKSVDADALTKFAQKTTIGTLLNAVVNAMKMVLMLVDHLKLGMTTAAAAVTALKLLAWKTNSSTQLYANANAFQLAAMKTKAGSQLLMVAPASNHESTNPCFVR